MSFPCVSKRCARVLLSWCRWGSAQRDWCGEEEADRLLVVDRRGQDLEVGGVHCGVLADCLHHHFANGDVLAQVGVGPAIGAGVGLLELDRAAGIDACQHAPAEVHGLDDAAFDAQDVL